MKRRRETQLVSSCFRPFRASVVLRAFVLVVAAIAPAFAINLQLSQADIERALTIARDRDKERARFHEPYITRLDGPFVEQIDIVTQFRRVVMTAEERILRGDRAFA